MKRPLGPRLQTPRVGFIYVRHRTDNVICFTQPRDAWATTHEAALACEQLFNCGFSRRATAGN
jgi:hypothetical protein